jgi:hypothetical protein
MAASACRRDLFGQPADFLIGFFAAASVGDNQDGFHISHSLFSAEFPAGVLNPTKVIILQIDFFSQGRKIGLLNINKGDLYGIRTTGITLRIRCAGTLH